MSFWTLVILLVKSSMGSTYELHHLWVQEIMGDEWQI